MNWNATNSDNQLVFIEPGPHAVPGVFLGSRIYNQPYARYDVYHNLIDSHDGNVVLANGMYYWFGVQYGHCIEPQAPGGGGALQVSGSFDGCSQYSGTGSCGFNINHNITLYSSPDLENWTPIYGPGPNGATILNMNQSWPIPTIAFCAKALWHPINKEFVLWIFNNVGYATDTLTEGQGYYSVLTSPTPQGPWTINTTNVTTLACMEGTDDMGFAQDPQYPYTAYITYSCLADLPQSGPNHVPHIERMTPDYHATLGASAGVAMPQVFTEAMAIFNHNGLWYYSYGNCSCYGFNATVNYIAWSTNPLGPYNLPGVPFSQAITGQQAAIFKYYDANFEEQIMYYSDQWQTAPSPGYKGADFNYWAPLKWSTVDNVTPLPLVYQEIITISVSTGPTPS